MKKLTPTEYRKCCVLVAQFKATLTNKDETRALRIMQQNQEYVRRYGRNPLPPSKDDLEPTQDGKYKVPELKIETFTSRSRKRNYGLTGRMLGCWTIEMAIRDLNLGQGFKNWLLRQNLGHMGADVSQHGKKPEYETLMRLFDYLLLTGYSEANVPSKSEAVMEAVVKQRKLAEGLYAQQRNQAV